MSPRAEPRTTPAPNNDFAHHGQRDAPYVEGSITERGADLKESLVHQHAHLHHDANAKKGGQDEVVYSQDKKWKGVDKPLDDTQTNDIQRRKGANASHGSMDTLNQEKGSLSRLDSEEDPHTHTLPNFYLRYRVIFHVFIWLLFTGLAISFMVSKLALWSISKTHNSTRFMFWRTGLINPKVVDSGSNSSW